MGLRLLPVLIFAGLLGPAPAVQAGPQEPSGPPPPSGTQRSAGPEVLELLPDIGTIGAEVAVFAGPSWNPYRVGPGLELGGSIDLPLRRAPGGKLSYQIFLGLSLATSDAFTLTLPTNPPVQRSVRTRLRVLHASPFALKYAVTRGDAVRLRPFLVAGADVLVVLTEQERAEGGPLVPHAPELEERGFPTGQGNIELGGHAAAGVEIRLSRGLSLNLEYRFTATGGRNARLHGTSAGLGFHW